MAKAARGLHPGSMRRSGAGLPGGVPFGSWGRSAAAATRNELPHGRNQVDRDFHVRVRGRLERRFVFGDRLFVGLGFLPLEYPPDAVLVPAHRKPVLLSHDSLRRRRLSARFALGPSSYAATTNTESGSGSGT
jgi:hypothetical protein